MITIDGAEYSDDLVWEDEFATPKRAGSSRQTMGAGGRTIYQNIQTEIKRSVRLVASYEGTELIGWWTRAQVKVLAGYEQAGTVVTLNYEGDELQVMVAVGGTAELRPFRPRPNMDDTDLYYGAVTFNEV